MTELSSILEPREEERQQAATHTHRNNREQRAESPVANLALDAQALPSIPTPGKYFEEKDGGVTSHLPQETTLVLHTSF